MSDEQRCFDQAQFRKLLEDGLTADEERELAKHLRQCEQCQQRLDELTGQMGLLSEAARRLVSEEAASDEEVDRVLDQLRAAGPGETAIPTVAPTQTQDGGGVSAGEYPLDVLSPPRDPAHLGSLGQYEIIGVIGQGGMGTVFRAIDSRLDRHVAIKILNPGLASGGVARRRFIREAQAAAAIRHDHVVTIHAVDEEDSVPYLVMEYVIGVSLQDRIQRTGPLKTEEILRIGMQTASGLAAAHAQGLVHRDIKPANILLENGVERVKITDFGLARVVDDARITKDGTIAGTPEYMSPEQAEDKKLDHRSDLFSLGCVMYAMCTGRSPFRASSVAAAINRVCNDAPRPIREVNAEVPDWLVGIIDRLLQKEPDKRFQSATEVAQLLQRCLSETQQRGGPACPPDLMPVARRADVPNRWRWVAATVACLSLILATVAWIGPWSKDETVADRNITDDEETSTGPEPLEPAPSETGQLKIRLCPWDVRLTISGGGKEWNFVKQEGYSRNGTLILEPGRYQVEVWNVKRNELLRSGPMRIDAGCIRAVEVYWTDATPLPPMRPAVFELAGHAGHVFSARFSPDGSRIATGGQDGAAIIWRQEGDNWRLEAKLTGHTAPVQCVAFSPDGRTLATASGDATVRLWNVETGELNQTIHSPDARPVKSAAFSPNGETIAFCSEASISLWSVLQNREIRTVQEPVGNVVFSLAFSNDGRILAVGARAPRLTLWNASTLERIHTIHAMALNTLSVPFSPDGSVVASTGHRGLAVLWDVETGQRLRTLGYASGTLKSGTFSPDGTLFAAAGTDKMISVWDVENGVLVDKFHGHWHDVESIDFSPHGDSFVTASTDGLAKVWRLQTDPGKPAKPDPTPVWAFECAQEWSDAPDGELAANFGGEIHTYSLNDFSMRRRIPKATHPWLIRARFLVGRRRAVAGGPKGKLRMWECVSEECPLVQEIPTGSPIHSIAVAPDEHTVATLHVENDFHLPIFSWGRPPRSIPLDDTIRLWDFDDEEGRFQETPGLLKSTRGALTSADFSPIDSSLVAGTVTGDVIIWDIDSDVPKEVTVLKHSDSRVCSVAFSPNGKTLATVGVDTTVKLWDVASGEVRLALDAHSTPVLSVAFSPDGSKLVTAGGDMCFEDEGKSGYVGEIKVWSADDGRLLCAFAGHTRPVTRAGFVGDGKYLATVGFQDRAMKLWDVSELLEYGVPEEETE